MAEFDIKKQKFRTFFNQLIENEKVLKGLNPKLINSHFQKHNSIPVFTLYVSDYQNIAIGKDESGIFRPVTHNSDSNLVSHKIFYNFLSPILEIPEDFLPFVNVQVEAKVIPTMKIAGLNTYNRISVQTNQTITVDGVIIYQGVGRDNQFRYSQEHIDSEEVFEENLKKVWKITNGTDEGFVTRIIIVYDRVDANTYKEYIIDYNGQSKHEITNLSTTSVTGIATVLQHTISGTTVLVDKLSTTKSFSGIESLTVDFERIALTTGTVNSIDNAEDTLTYWLYFDSDKTPPRVGFDTDVGDRVLFDVPDASTDLGTIVVTPFLVQTEEATINIGNKNFGFLKTSKSTENIDRWKIKIDGSFVIIGKPEFEETVASFTTEKKNTYPYLGDYFTRNDEDVEGTRNLYRLPTQDIQWRINIYLKNPFYQQSNSIFKNV